MSAQGVKSAAEILEESWIRQDGILSKTGQVVLYNDWARKGVHDLIKNLDGSQLAALANALLKKESGCTDCVLMRQNKDGRVQVQHVKRYPHYVYCRIFRWSDLEYYGQLVGTCIHAFKPKDEASKEYPKNQFVCINPYHYDRKLGPPSAPPVVVPAAMTKTPLQTSNSGGSKKGSDMDCSLSGLEAMSLDGSLENGSLLSGELLFAMDSQVKLPKPQIWATIEYYELNCRVGDAFDCRQPSIRIDGQTEPNRKSNRFSLGRLGNPNRDLTVEKVRHVIGNGIWLTQTENSIKIDCLPETNYSVFIHSPLMNARDQLPLEEVKKLTPGSSAEVFGFAEFQALLQTKTMKGVYQEVLELAKLCRVKVSFVKGWGSERYANRPQVTNCPCWVEVQLHAPQQWIDDVLQKLKPTCTLKSQS